MSRKSSSKTALQRTIDYYRRGRRQIGRNLAADIFIRSVPAG